MIYTILMLSTAHLPQSEVTTLSVMIQELGLIEGAMEGPKGILLPADVTEITDCPPITSKVLAQVGTLFNGSADQVIFSADGPRHPSLDTFDWV